MISISTLLKHYKRQDVRERIIEEAENKEIGVMFGMNTFGKRPDVLLQANDIIDLVKKGATSFHASEELWNNPLNLGPELKPKDIQELRTGWDLIIDIDCKFLEYSQIAAELIMQTLDYHEIENSSIKFSVTGNTPILIKLNDVIKLIPIKDVIQLLKKSQQVKVLSLDKNLKLDFFDVYNYLVHKDKIYKLYCRQTGVPLLVTGHHSVFVWENCKVIQKYVKDIHKGDFLISYNSFAKFKSTRPSSIIKFLYNKKEVVKKHKITKQLCRLIGYYLSEGHLADINYMIGFSFDAREKEYINDCKTLVEKFSKNSPPSEHKTHPSSTQVIFYSKEAYIFFKHNCGKGSKNKHLPDFAWKLPKNYFLELMRGYLRGDAHKKSLKYLTVKSVSKQLITELIWLCKIHKISSNLYCEKNKPHILNNKMFKGSFVFILKIPRRDLFIKEFNIKRNKFSRLSADKVYPTQPLLNVYYQIKPSLFNKHRPEQATLKKKMASAVRLLKVIKWFELFHTIKPSTESRNIINSYKLLLSSDISLLPVTKLISGDTKTVYDVSVRESERFFGGYFPILLHNSGNHGFHIAIPFQSFPERIQEQETRNIFPEGPRKIAAYLQEFIKEHLKNKMLEYENITQIKQKTGMQINELTKNNQFNPYSIISIDTILISHRHLYRMSYCFNEKSGLISTPITKNRILNFDKEQAKPEYVNTSIKFLDRTKTNNAKRLIVQALDFQSQTEMQKQTKENKISEKNELFEAKQPVPEQYFPPCINSILKGIKDGKKRSVFVLINFLTMCGWDHEKTEQFILEWNKKNPEPLREGIIKAQISYHKRSKKKILPPNCFNKQYYVELGFCQPDNFCKKIKNPANYSVLKQKIVYSAQDKKQAL